MQEVSTQKFRRFLRLWLATLISVLCITAAINYLIDPYGLFDTTRVSSLNELKPAAGGRVRSTKSYQVERFSPRTLIGGNSRPEIGLDPLSACWTEDLRPVFNIGLPGANVYLQMRMLQHAIAGSNVKTLLWGLDFMDFFTDNTGTADPRIWPPDHASKEDRLRINADGTSNASYASVKLKNQILALFSLNTVKDSIHTIYSQRNPNSSTRRRDGFNPGMDYLDIIAWEGQSVLFAQKNQEMAERFTRSDLRLFQTNTRWSSSFESVHQLLTFAKKYQVQVILFINPYHADYLTLLELSGHWPAFELWKRQLVAIAAQNEVELWDFSNVSSYTIEQIPIPETDTTQLKWFWEPAHYKREYGDLMLSQMLGEPCDPVEKPTGKQLDDRNVESYLRQSREEMDNYKEIHPNVVSRLKTLHRDLLATP